MHHWLKLSPSSMQRDPQHAPKRAGRCEDQDYYQHISQHPICQRRWDTRCDTKAGERAVACLQHNQGSYSNAPQKHTYLLRFPLPKVTCTETVPSIAPASSFILRWLLRWRKPAFSKTWHRLYLVAHEKQLSSLARCILIHHEVHRIILHRVRVLHLSCFSCKEV